MFLGQHGGFPSLQDFSRNVVIIEGFDGSLRMILQTPGSREVIVAKIAVNSASSLKSLIS
jgi:hypothetical protein